MTGINSCSALPVVAQIRFTSNWGRIFDTLLRRMLSTEEMSGELAGYEKFIHQ